MIFLDVADFMCDDGVNLLRAPVSIQLVLQQLLKHVVIAEPSVFQIQTDQEQVVLLESGDELIAIHLVCVGPSVRPVQRIA